VLVRVLMNQFERNGRTCIGCGRAVHRRFSSVFGSPSPSAAVNSPAAKHSVGQRAAQQLDYDPHPAAAEVDEAGVEMQANELHAPHAEPEDD